MSSRATAADGRSSTSISRGRTEACQFLEMVHFEIYDAESEVGLAVDMPQLPRSPNLAYGEVAPLFCLLPPMAMRLLMRSLLPLARFPQPSDRTGHTPAGQPHRFSMRPPARPPYFIISLPCPNPRWPWMGRGVVRAWGRMNT